MGTIYHWIREVIYKMIIKKNIDKSQILLIVPFETDIWEYEYRMRKLVGHIAFSNVFLKNFFFFITLVFLLQNIFH